MAISIENAFNVKFIQSLGISAQIGKFEKLNVTSYILLLRTSPTSVKYMYIKLG